jgi:light-harvesting protein B-800-850 beta chain
VIGLERAFAMSFPDRILRANHPDQGGWLARTDESCGGLALNVQTARSVGGMAVMPWLFKINYRYEYDVHAGGAAGFACGITCVNFLLQLKMSSKNDRFARGLHAYENHSIVHAAGASGMSSTHPRTRRRRGHGGAVMTNDPDKVWPTGLNLREAEEVHSYLIDGTRVFGVIALLAHILVAVATPWLG